MNVRIPFTRTQMLEAMLKNKEQMASVADDFGDKVLAKTKEVIGANAGEKAQLAASFFGVTTGEIINSPNYNTLITEFEQNGAEKVVEFIKQEAGVSDACAWAILFEGLA